MFTLNRRGRVLAAVVTLATGPLLVAGCSSGGGGGDSDSRTAVDVAIDTGSEGQNIALDTMAGPVSVIKSFDYDASEDYRFFTVEGDRASACTLTLEGAVRAVGRADSSR